MEQDIYDWYARHHAEIELKKTLKPRLVLIGDSITHFWDGLPRSSEVNGPTAWQRVFGNMPVLNMGFGWDRTQNVLWRLRQGEFDDLRPEWVVLMIGTNNLTGTDHARANTPEEIVDGIDAIIRRFAGVRRKAASLSWRSCLADKNRTIHCVLQSKRPIADWQSVSPQTLLSLMSTLVLLF